MRALSRRHPKGCLWNLGSKPRLHPGKSLSEPSYKDGDEKLCDQGDLEHVKSVFPVANQLLFVPVFDTNSIRPSFCLFVQSCEEDYSFNIQIDLSFLHAFCSTISTSISRIEAWRNGKQQSDFVSNISHELRSPLHGIIASTQFLHDSGHTDFQRTMLTTIEQCSETLLDTIDNLLDYSKINAFEKRGSAAEKISHCDDMRRTGAPSLMQNSSSTAPSLVQLYAVTDISAVLEQVVDSLVLSNVYYRTVDNTDVSQEAREKTRSSESKSGPSARHLSVARPQVIMEIEKGDWSFATQPGAMRRIISNLVGNALKYTYKGLIKISLSFSKANSNRDSEIVLLMVTDTGIGMSQQFLDSKLYLPFSQENSLSPGTGLGLSIVHSIATMMGGEVEFESSVGKGTTASVTLPLRRPVAGQNSTHRTPDPGEYAQSDILPSYLRSTLQVETPPVSMSYYGAMVVGRHSLRRVLDRYLLEWFQLRNIASWWDATMVIVDLDDLEHFFRETNKAQSAAIIALYDVEHIHFLAERASRFQRERTIIQFVSVPFGPHKLAKAIKDIIDRRTGIILQNSAGSKDHADVETYGLARTTPEQLDFTKADRKRDVDDISTNDTPSLEGATTDSAFDLINPAAYPATFTSSSILSDDITRGSPFPLQPQCPTTRVVDGTGGSRASMSTRSMKTSISAVSGTTAAEVDVKNSLKISLTSRADPRILLVDDNAINLRLLETYLRKRRGYTRIMTAVNGQEAVDAFIAVASSNESRFELIFMDISMPIMNGFDATRKLRQYESILRLRCHDGVNNLVLNEQQSGRNDSLIIALTSLASGKDRAEGFECGLDMYMTKPVIFEELSRILDNWESQRRDVNDNEV